ncbi:MAG: HPr family phosphocarrier protein [Gemmataceae bacterium]|nr:HPr family phosphocarrier protein [Gemmataceae bacterium]
MSVTIAMENGPLLGENNPLQAMVVIRNPRGLHMRPAMMIARLAAKYQCTGTLRKQDRKASLRSMTQLMLLAALQGTELELEVTGEDAQVALPILAKAIAANSSEDLELMLK